MDKANIIESIDVLKAQSDLISIERRDRVYNDLNEVIDKLQKIDVFPSLLWVWAFDIIRDIHENNQEPQEYLDEVVPEGVTLKQIFDKFWDDVDGLGIDMDHGGEIIEEVIRDWMRENDFLVQLDDDGWLDEPNTFGNGIERGDDV